MTLRKFTLIVDSNKKESDLVADIRATLHDLAEQTSDGTGAWPVLYGDGEPQPSNFTDVRSFHAKFDVPQAVQPAFLDVHATSFRTKFMQEELDEFGEALIEKDLAKAGDALVDLVYVALGTAAMMGLPWQAMWDEVQRANMAKERASKDGSNSLRSSALDVVKPAGWTPPDHSAFIGEGPWPTFMTTERVLSWSGSDFVKMEQAQAVQRSFIEDAEQMTELKASSAELSPGQQAILAAIPDSSVSADSGINTPSGASEN